MSENKTLRDEFAMAALTGLVHCYDWKNEETVADFAKHVWSASDAMLAEREKLADGQIPQKIGNMLLVANRQEFDALKTENAKLKQELLCLTKSHADEFQALTAELAKAQRAPKTRDEIDQSLDMLDDRISELAGAQRASTQELASAVANVSRTLDATLSAQNRANRERIKGKLKKKIAHRRKNRPL